MFELDRTFKNKDLTELKSVYRSVGWNKHDEEIIQRIFENSTHTVFAIEHDRVIGFARAISDGVFNAAIYDVVVHADYQGKGIARHLMEDLLHQLNGHSCIHLISTTGNEAFYKKLGFKDLKTGMAIYKNKVLAAEYLL